MRRGFSSERVLYVIALIARTGIWFPLWQLVLGIGGFAVRGKAFGILFAGGLTIGFLSAKSAQMRKKRKMAVSALLIFGILCVTAAAGWLLISATSGFAAALMLLPMAIFMAGCGEKDAESLFTTTMFVAFLTCEVLCLLALHLTGRDTGAAVIGFLLDSQSNLHIAGAVQWGAAALVLESLCYLLLRNQLMLIRYVSRRGGAEVPKDIRRGNLRLLLGLVVFACVCCLLYRPMISAVQWLSASAAWLVGVVLRAFVSLINHLSGNSPDADEPLEPMQQSPMMNTGEASPLWMLVWVGIAAVVGLLVYHNFRDVLGDVRLFFLELAEKIRRFLHPHDDCTKNLADAEFFDVETECLPAEEVSVRRQRRQWIKLYRKWQNSAENETKFYDGYRLLTQAPAWQKNPPISSDTIAEIGRKWDSALASETGCDLHAVTENYHENRFGGRVMRQDALSSLAAALAAVSRQK